MAPAPAQGVDWDALTSARRALIANPYALDDDQRRLAVEQLLGNRDHVPGAMKDLCARGLPRDARKLVLATAHAVAFAGIGMGSHLGHLERGVETCRPSGFRLEVRDLRRLAWALERFFVAEKRLLGTSKPMRRLREMLWTACFGADLHVTLERELAIRQQNILILGEPGTGKELVANVLQAAVLTDRPDGAPAQSINCAAIPTELAESELFGFEKGAHSKADAKKQGKIAAADGGTLFLDEVADLPSQVQAKLLSVLSNGRLTPLGSNEAQVVDVRYVSATSRPLLQMVEQKAFRDDLYSRLGQTVLEVPPLRDRPDDILEIGDALYEKLAPREVNTEEGSSNVAKLFASQKGSPIHDWLRKQIPQRSWQGNVRELEAVVREHLLGFRETTQARGPTPASPPSRSHATAELLAVVPQRILDCTATDEEVGAWYLKRVLKHTKGNQSEAERILGIDRGTIRRRAAKLGLTDKAPKDDDSDPT
jgi:DNA-binding NtrC family response regulator